MKKLDDADQIEVELTLTEVMQKQIADTFDMELDLMNGKVRTLPDGTSEYKMTLAGTKMKMMIDFFRMIVSLPTDQTVIKINGHTLHKN